MNFGLLTAPQRMWLETARAIADRDRHEVWLVGGPVRDLLLGRPVADLDFVLETGTAAFTAQFAAAVGGNVQSFPRFGTFKIVLPEGSEIDVSTSRGERYAHPGALPEVYEAPLGADLRRRDFSINALALHLLSGEIVDTTGGCGDLTAGSLRILHERSFEDDPTRLFRGVRLGARLGFAFDQATGERLRHAVRSTVTTSVARERIWREVGLALGEDAPGGVVAAFLAHGLLDHFFELDPSRPSTGELRRVDRILSATLGSFDRWMVLLGLVLSGTSRGRWSDGAPLSTHQRRLIRKTADSIRSLAQASSNTTDEALFTLALPLPDEALPAAASAEGADEARLLRLLSCRRHPVAIRPDAGLPPGPHIGRALAAARKALFAGDVNADGIDAFARAKALQYLSERT